MLLFAHGKLLSDLAALHKQLHTQHMTQAYSNFSIDFSVATDRKRSKLFPTNVCARVDEFYFICVNNIYTNVDS